MSDTQGQEGVAQGGWLAGADDESYLREADSECDEELDKLSVVEKELGVRLILVVSSVGTHPGEGDVERGFPAMFVKILEVGCQGESFSFPVGQAKEGTDADSAESSRVGAFRAFESPVEVFLRSCGVELGVGFAVIRFLIDDESFGAVVDEFSVLIVFQWAYLDGDGGDEGFNGIDTGLEVAFGDELRVFSGDE